MPSWHGQANLYLDLMYKRCVASIFLFLCTQICRTCENWLTAEVTDLENDSSIFHVQFILVVILIPENIRKKNDKILCVHFLYNLSSRLTYVQWFGNRRRRHRRRYRVYNNKSTSVADALFTISWNNSCRNGTAHFFCRFRPQLSYYPKFI
jgi:hypothetical protein